MQAELSPQDRDLSSAMAFFVMRGWDFTSASGMSSAWSYVMNLQKQGRAKMAADATNALHLLLGDSLSVEVETNCNWPRWSDAKFVYNPYCSNIDWPVRLDLPQTPEPIDWFADISTTPASHPSSLSLTSAPLVPHLLLRWTPTEEATFRTTRRIVEERLQTYSSLQGLNYVTEGEEVILSVWLDDPSRAEEAQLCMHGRALEGEVRVFVRTCETDLESNQDDEDSVVEVTYKRKQHRDTCRSDDARSLAFLYDTFARCVGNVEHVALSGQDTATIKFFTAEAAEAALAPDSLPKPFPKWVEGVRRPESAHPRESHQGVRSESSESN